MNIDIGYVILNWIGYLYQPILHASQHAQQLLVGGIHYTGTQWHQYARRVMEAPMLCPSLTIHQTAERIAEPGSEQELSFSL